jgi:hypothetical protein
MVMFTIVSPPEHHAELESIMEQLYREEVQLAPLLQSLNVQVTFLNGRGKPVKEYTLGQTQPKTASSNQKPWWRFW